jgi:hypothetical protein
MLYETANKGLFSVLFSLSIAASASTASQAGEPPAALKSLTDDHRKRVYVLARHGVDVLEPGTRRRLAFVPLPGWTWADEWHACPPDIALAPQGDVLVTSNVLPVIWRINYRTLATTVHEPKLDQDTNKDVGFTSLRWSAAERAFVGITDLGTTWRIDPSLSTALKTEGPATPKDCRL